MARLTGSGYGSGYGYGYGEVLADIRGYEARGLTPWSLLRIGCEIHSAATWRARWREIAAAHDVEATDALGAQIEAACAAAERGYR